MGESFVRDISILYACNFSIETKTSDVCSLMHDTDIDFSIPIKGNSFVNVKAMCVYV